MTKKIAAIVGIGDEILKGKICNTNAQWLGRELHKFGITLKTIINVPDELKSIENELLNLSQQVDLVFISGGLGPTDDDKTKQAIANALNCELVMDEEVSAFLHNYFKKKGRKLNELNEKQAERPEKSIAHINYSGSAPMLEFKIQNCTYFAMPGVPYELKSLSEKYIFPKLNEISQVKPLIHSITFGKIPESKLQQKINKIKDKLSDAVNLAYYPSYGTIELRLETDEDKQLELDTTVIEIISNLRKYLISEVGLPIEQALGKLLKEYNKTIGTAESCTAGGIASTLVGVSGASAYFQGSVLTYSNELKMKLLGVREKSLKGFGAVSSIVVEEMAENARKKLRVDYTISVSGIAGPSGGTPEKPVGTVWIGFSSEKRTISKKFQFVTDRKVNTALSIQNALVLAFFEIRNLLGLKE